MFKGAEKLCKQKLNEYVSQFFGRPTTLDWTLLWYNNYGQDSPTWHDLRDKASGISAVAQVEVDGRTVWLAFRPGSAGVGIADLLTLGVAAAAMSKGPSLVAWLVDPSGLPDCPGSYASTHPTARHGRVADLVQLRQLIGG